MKKNIKLTQLILAAFLILATGIVEAQNVGSSPEYIKALTSEWKGERFPDGRPKVSDQILERLKNISIEDAWGVLRNKGYQNIQDPLEDNLPGWHYFLIYFNEGRAEYLIHFYTSQHDIIHIGNNFNM